MEICRCCGRAKDNLVPQSKICSGCNAKVYDDIVDLSLHYMIKGHTDKCAARMAICKPCSCGADSSYLFK